MASQGLQILGVLLAFFGWLGAIITCGLPMWRVTAFVGANIVTAQVIWEGLWMSCVVQSTGQMQCKMYDSMLALPQDLQTARAMVIISVIVGIFGILMAVIGGKCTNCMEDDVAKAKTCIVAGVIFIITALLILIPVSWSAHAVISDFYNPLLVCKTCASNVTHLVLQGLSTKKTKLCSCSSSFFPGTQSTDTL
uniref:Claudin n=1 Tax=Astatotilapia calliptera TaxID=8154 RepID=A0A3P8NYP1_ASTCA